jgi:raffinose/stachyose/melibiose transport system substrate-binding protein
MRKAIRSWSCMFLALLTALTGGLSARAEGVTVRTVSTFAGLDAAADTYIRLLRQWETDTGNWVEDTSSPSDEGWKNGVLSDFAAGNEPDVLFYFSGTSDSEPILSRVVPIEEINAAYPEARLTQSVACRERDGQIYAIPVRDYWEGLFVNTDLFRQFALELPTDWAKLETAIAVFHRAGIIPISVSLGDVPHYLAEVSILACGGAQEHAARPGAGEAVPDSWVEGMELIRRLQEMNAFSSDAAAVTDAVSAQRFIDGEAAMRIDGSWFANGIPQGRMEDVCVMPFPNAGGEAEPLAFIGGVSMGFYLTRKAWRSSQRRDAAVSLLSFLTTGENALALGGYTYSGRLLESAQAMTRQSALRVAPIQDAMHPQARSLWFSLIPAVAGGSLDARAMWDQVMELDPFEK